MRSQADRLIEEKASLQYGLVTLEQALACGHSRKTVDHRVATRRLIPTYPTVYAVAGAPSSWHGDLLAAVLWSGGNASHRSAAFLHQLPGVKDPPLEITTFRREVMPHSGVIVHHTKRLPLDQSDRSQGIATTSIERTLLDLGAVWSERHVAVAMDAALHRGDTTLGMLDRCLYLTARRGRRGCAVLRRVLHRRLELTTFPESPLESLLYELLASSPLPDPVPQVPVRDAAGRLIARPDFLYPEFKLAVEAHSLQWHDSPEARAADARRHARLVACGYRIVYVTYRDIIDLPGATLVRVEKALRAGGWVPGSTAIGVELRKNG